MTAELYWNSEIIQNVLKLQMTQFGAIYRRSIFFGMKAQKPILAPPLLPIAT